MGALIQIYTRKSQPPETWWEIAVKVLQEIRGPGWKPDTGRSKPDVFAAGYQQGEGYDIFAGPHNTEDEILQFSPPYEGNRAFVLQRSESGEVNELYMWSYKKKHWVDMR